MAAMRNSCTDGALRDLSVVTSKLSLECGQMQGFRRWLLNGIGALSVLVLLTTADLCARTNKWGAFFLTYEMCRTQRGHANSEGVEVGVVVYNGVIRIGRVRVIQGDGVKAGNFDQTRQWRSSFSGERGNIINLLVDEHSFGGIGW